MQSIDYFVRVSGRAKYGDSFSGRVVVDMNMPEEKTLYIGFTNCYGFPLMDMLSAATRALISSGMAKELDHDFIHNYCDKNGIVFNLHEEKCGKAEAIRFGRQNGSQL